MYSISEISQMTGITAYTLRYYEKIGILSSPARKEGKQHGVRTYSAQDLQYIRFIHGLKQTGMKLEDIAVFVEDGCLLTQDVQEMDDLSGTLLKRITMLDRHLQRLAEQIKQLESVKGIAEEKKSFYQHMLKDQMPEGSNK